MIERKNNPQKGMVIKMKEKRKFAPWIAVIAVILAVASLGALRIADAVKRLRLSGSEGVALAAAVPKNGCHIYLLTGVDNAGFNSDVIMLVSVNDELGKIGVLQIPRDSYVNIEGKSYHKINAIYSEACRIAANKGKSPEEAHRAGNHALACFLEEVFAIKIEGYAGVTTSGLARIVDSLGGVDVNIPSNLSYDDNSQNLHIRLKAGMNHLNGDLAVKFVRCRSYSNADYGRMNAQKVFVSAMIKKVKGSFSITNAVPMVKCILANVNTDMDVSKVMPLAKTAMSFEAENIRMVNLVGSSVKVGSAYCEVLSVGTTKRILSENLFFGEISAKDLTFDPCGHMNNPSDPEINRLYKAEKVS